jgi:molybdopterin-guanine dinucleotide biosynthesis protein A
MPFVTEEIINTLISYQGYSIAYFENNNLPLMVRNSSEIRDVLENQIKNRQLSIYQLFDILDVKRLKNNFHVELFANINSPNQWQEALNKLLLTSF